MRPALDRRCHGLGWHAEVLPRPPHTGRIPDRAGGRDLQQLPGARRQIGDLPSEPVLDPVHKGPRGRRPEATRQLRERTVAGQLQQRKRVASRLAEHPLADTFVQWPSHHRRQQPARLGLWQALDGEIGQPAQVGAGLSGGDQEQDRLGQQPARGEGQCPLRCPVQPVAVIDQAHQRTVLGRLGQQAQHRQANDEVIGRWPGLQAQRDRQRIPLRLRQERKAIQERGAELVQSGEGQLHL